MNIFGTKMIINRIQMLLNIRIKWLKQMNSEYLQISDADIY